MDTHFILPLICISFKIESIKNNINALLIFEIGKSYRFLPITNIKYITIAYVTAISGGSVGPLLLGGKNEEEAKGDEPTPHMLAGLVPAIRDE